MDKLPIDYSENGNLDKKDNIAHIRNYHCEILAKGIVDDASIIVQIVNNNDFLNNFIGINQLISTFNLTLHGYNTSLHELLNNRVHFQMLDLYLKAIRSLMPNETDNISKGITLSEEEKRKIKTIRDILFRMIENLKSWNELRNSGSYDQKEIIKASTKKIIEEIIK